jgi:hypothetical protein
VAGLNLPAGTKSSLDAKLRAALTALTAGDVVTACARMQDFIGYAIAQSGKKIPAATANALVAEATSIRSALGC